MLFRSIYAGQGATAVLAPCVLLWAMLYTLGLILEGRSYAMRFELQRLLLLVPLGTAAMQGGTIAGADAGEVWVACLIYILASIAGLGLCAASRSVSALEQDNKYFKTDS